MGFYDTPQVFPPLLAGYGTEQQDFDILGEEDMLAALQNFVPQQAAAQLPMESEMVVEPMEPDAPLSWQQRLADSEAADLFPEASREDKDIALRAGKRALGDVLLQAALAPDARSRAKVLAQMFPYARKAFQGELGGLEERRIRDENREYVRETRDHERSRRAFEEEGFAEKRDERDRERAEMDALSNEDFSATFDGLITDDDLTPEERETFRKKFGVAQKRFDANPTPANADSMLKLMSDLETAAGRSGEVQKAVALAHQEAAGKLGIPLEEYEATILPQLKKSKLAELHKSAIELAKSQADLSGKLTDNAIAAKNLELIGSDAGLPPGFVRLPNGKIQRDPTYSNRPIEDPRRNAVDAALKDDEFKAWLAAPQGAPAPIGVQMQLMMAGAKDRADFMRVVQEVAAGSIPSGGIPKPGTGVPNPGTGVQIPRAEIEKAAKDDGVSFDEAVKALEAKLKKPVTVI